MQILLKLQALFNEWLPWVTGAAGLTAVLSWLPGGGAIITILTSALRFVASFFEMISPIVNALFSGVIWVWKNILLPGVMNILTSWATIGTVLALGFTLWFFLISKYEYQGFKTNRELSTCQRALTSCKVATATKGKVKTPVHPAEADTEFPWYFWK